MKKVTAYKCEYCGHLLMGKKPMELHKDNCGRKPRTNTNLSSRISNYTDKI